MSADWPPLTYGAWSATCDTLHAHTQVLGKLAVQLAPPEPQLQHAALRLTARGWETFPLPAPDDSGAIVAALDLRTHEAVVEHTGRHEIRIALTPDRPVAEVTRELLEGVGQLAAWSRSTRHRRRFHGPCRSTRTTSTRPMTPTRWRPTSRPPPRRRSSWPKSGPRFAGARRRSTPGGAPST